MAKFDKQYMEGIKELEEHKRRVVEVKAAMKKKKVVMGVADGCGMRFWWEDESVGCVGYKEVEHYLIALEM